MQTQQNGFDRYTSDTVGDSLRVKGREWLRAGKPDDPDNLYAVLMRTMKMGGSSWADSRLKQVIANLVIIHGVPDEPPPDMGPYSSCVLVDQSGLIATFTSHSWGGWNALTDLIPEFRLTVDPRFVVTGWTPAEQYDVVTGPSPVAIAAPEKKAEPVVKKSAGEIIDDSIPFALTAAMLLPIAVLIAGRIA